MPIPATSDLPKPKSWDEFEDIVWEIYTRKWNDSYAQRYGRHGQPQHGIDIYGQQNKSSSYIAIQCKRYEDRKLSLQTISIELHKTESFTSTISEYIIATVASRDKRVQDAIRLLNEERQAEKTFLVYVVFWEDICKYLLEENNRDLLKKYYSEWENIFVNQQKDDDKKSEVIQDILISDIKADCKLLQEILNYNGKDFLSNKWQSCLKQNRSIYQDISTKILLHQKVGNEMMQNIQEFYSQLDTIEEQVKNLIASQLQAQTLRTKPKYGTGILGFGTMNPPLCHEKYFTESDAIKLSIVITKNLISLGGIKDITEKALDLGSQIIRNLNRN